MWTIVPVSVPSVRYSTKYLAGGTGRAICSAPVRRQRDYNDKARSLEPFWFETAGFVCFWCFGCFEILVIHLSKLQIPAFFM
jgi:hypothetical protein